MKFLKTLILALAVSIAAINVADAGSIGRSGGSSFSSGRSSSSSSFSSSRPSSSSSSIGVSKSTVTNGVRNDMPKPSTPSTPNYGSTPSPSYGSAPTPHYAPAYSPAPTVVHHDGGFGSAFAGSMFGSMMGNALSRPATAPVVVTGGGQVVSGGGQVVSSGETIVSNPNTPVVVEKESYGIGHLILDVILFAVLMGVLVGICLLAYKGIKALKNYVNSERGLDNNPFPPTQRFWEIQRAFGTADKVELSRLLGPDMLDEILNDIEPSEIKLNNVSHEVRLLNNREFSVWYKFDDKLEEVHVNQVWHFEKIGGEWKLNGIETI